jgi:hypothetical protein
MCPRRNKSDNPKRQERETRQQDKKSREKKNHSKEDNDDERGFRNQLRTFNLQLRDIAGDGNCLFRSCKLLIKVFSFQNYLSYQ